jgi:hypothetical protein
MSQHKEKPTPQQEGFGFTENEKLFSRVNHERFTEMVFDEKTTIHKAQIDANNFGEYFFVTTSRATTTGRECITYWGLGFHEQRDRWITKEWFWHRANQFPETMRQELSKEEIEELMHERQQEIMPYVTDSNQSKQGQLFEMLADLTDEDGAYTEIEDLENWFDDL